MSQDNLIGLKCEDCKKSIHSSRKNKKKLAQHKLELKKFCSVCKKQTLHKETKKQVA